jgi:hypothetical protein
MRDGLRILSVVAVVVMMIPACANLVPTTFGFPVIVQNGSTSAFNQDTASAVDFEDVNVDFPAFVDDLVLGPALVGLSTGGDFPVGISTAGDSRVASYTTPGTYTFTVPEGVTSVGVTAIGGGGGGGGGGGYAQIILNIESSETMAGAAGGGGGSGYVTVLDDVPVAPGQQVTVVVGRGGNGNSGGASDTEQRGQTATGQDGITGDPGGQSSFGTYVANGGLSGGGGGGSQLDPDRVGALGEGGAGNNPGQSGQWSEQPWAEPPQGGPGGAGYSYNGLPYGAGGNGGNGGDFLASTWRWVESTPGTNGGDGAVFVTYTEPGPEAGSGLSPPELSASANVLPFGPVNLAFPDIDQTVIQTQEVTHTDFAQTNEYAEFAYPFAGVGPVALPGFGFGW